VGDIISGRGFGHFGSGYLALGPTARWKYFTKFLLETRLESEFLSLWSSF